MNKTVILACLSIAGLVISEAAQAIGHGFGSLNLTQDVTLILAGLATIKASMGHAAVVAQQAPQQAPQAPVAK